jgi:plastocyanin
MKDLRMNRFMWITGGALALGACGADSDEGGRTGAAAAAPVVIENPARINGHVMLTGTPPAPRPIDMRDEPGCAERHSGTVTDGSVVGTDGNLGNVFIYVKEGITGTFPVPSEPVVIDQVGCVYVPRVVGVRAGQSIVLRNSDGLAHNIKATPRANRPFNISQPNNMDTTREFGTPEVMIPLECNVHGWMIAYVGVIEHPYFAVSDASGSFDLSNLPAGTYTVEAWHERFGTQTQQVTVGPNEAIDLHFSFDAAAAAGATGGPAAPHMVALHHADAAASTFRR